MRCYPIRPLTVTILQLLLLVVLALAGRIATLREPLNSDDDQYIAAATLFGQGNHPIQTSIKPSDKGFGNHHHLRLGIIIPVYLLMKQFGVSVVTYYTFPLLMSVVAIALTFLILRRFVGPSVAFLTTLFQILNPLEITHATNLLADMPTATLSVACFAMLVNVSERDCKKHVAISFGLLLGFLLTWIYLLRSNAPVLLGPLLLCALITKRTRLTLFVGSVVLILAVIGEEWVYFNNGAEFGYRFNVASLAVDRYVPFLPVYDEFTDYLLRYPRAVANKSNLIILVTFYLSIIAHIYIILFNRDFLLRGFAASGLSALIIFWFFVFAPIRNGFVTQPAAMRYIQLFLSTSLIVTPIALVNVSKLIVALTAQKSESSQRSVRIILRTAGCLFCVILMAAAFRSNVLDSRRFWSENSRCYPILSYLHDHMQQNNLKSIEVMGTHGSIRGIKIFTWLPPNKHVTWRKAELPEMLIAAATNSEQLFITDLVKEKSWLKYVRNEDQLKRRTERFENLSVFANLETQTVARSSRLILSKRGALPTSRTRLTSLSLVANKDFEHWNGNRLDSWRSRFQGNPEVFQQTSSARFGTGITIGKMYLSQSVPIKTDLRNAKIVASVWAKAIEPETCVIFLRFDSRRSDEWIQSASSFHPGDGDWQQLKASVFIPPDFIPDRMMIMLSNRNDPQYPCSFAELELTLLALDSNYRPNGD